jgi:PD-(D/E)XK nuclease superfamily protein
MAGRAMMRLSGRVIGLAIEVHRQLGPGLLESAYKSVCALSWLKPALNLRGRFRCRSRIMPIHKAQLLTYLRLSGHRVGLLLNFNTVVLKDDIHRLVL